MINLIAKKIVDRVGVVKTSPVNRVETSQQIDPPKVGLTLTERLVLCRKLVKRKRTGMENREDTFEEDVAKNGVEVGMVKIRSKICDKFTFQIMSRDMVTLKKVIVIFKFTTSRTIRTFASMTTVDNVANGKNAMSPFEKECWTTVILIANSGVELPINITGEGPWTRGNDVLV